MAVGVRLPEVNVVFLSGRLTRDPEIRFLPSGQAVGKLGVASNRRFLNKASNEWQDEVAFVDVTVWGDAAVRLKEKVKKGSPVFVEGRLRFRQWETKDGAKRSTLEVAARRVQSLEFSASTALPSTAPSPDYGAALEEAQTVKDGEETGLPTFGSSDPEEAASDLEGVAL